jgi:MFS superfamily sulfate permease-like transporter
MEEESDLVTEPQLDRVQAALRRILFMQLAVAAATGIAFAAVAILVGYVLGSDSTSFGPVAALAGVIVAALMAMNHWKTFRSELKKISELRRRVRLGESVYGTSLSLPKQA